jgi:glycosyltransferase involved in cell wall biosynthesis
MLLPSNYPEICANVILQALASGVPIVTTGGLGSSGEWISQNNGALTQWQPYDYMAYTLNIIRESVRILEDESLHRKLIKNAQNTFVHSWEQIGALWERMLTKLI